MDFLVWSRGKSQATELTSSRRRACSLLFSVLCSLFERVGFLDSMRSFYIFGVLSCPLLNPSFHLRFGLFQCVVLARSTERGTRITRCRRKSVSCIVVGLAVSVNGGREGEEAKAAERGHC
eukprot:TRINITY_DN27_c0_g1_i3.p1 TRINITY_DN27_c0_g1~~TRINITY_DN27_c0_g1_i3.p1  ORF type:complete len:121 (-),score=5.26 TRINITY_DN27_c0_g1_i3:343-705(-)